MHHIDKIISLNNKFIQMNIESKRIHLDIYKKTKNLQLKKFAKTMLDYDNKELSDLVFLKNKFEKMK